MCIRDRGGQGELGHPGSDTAAVLHAVSEHGVVGAVSEIAGPFTLVVWDPREEKLWLGRDALGRRSLVWTVDGDGGLIFSSAPVPEYSWRELPPGLYCVNLGDHQSERVIAKHRWSPGSVQEELGLHLETMSHPAATECGGTSDQFLEVLSSSVGRRVATAPDQRVAVLFSGGLDSAVIGRLVHEHMPPELPIELVNVSFGKNGSYETPDRLTAEATLTELKELAPGREWLLVCVNVSLEEAACEAERLRDLIAPLDTVMDHNIGMAFWFAARGEGWVNCEPYRVQSRVLLMGAGADEQLAGYSRHRGAWERGGDAELQCELQMDFKRLWTRNLGRKHPTL
eukprot:TRINITY_DN49449_c0_g1_i2.p1 TRINITY_DN49449_c0_g1~~TRINITY_DN49449_c0_g1_i2.p1  ORF type:complete len:341 (-),score=82.12 TRINITY_DN49449_c0_g1_i2:1-1023(-)